jgi:hypothetical protein
VFVKFRDCLGVISINLRVHFSVRRVAGVTVIGALAVIDDSNESMIAGTARFRLSNSTWLD